MNVAILVTGMSGTGTSAVLHELARRGHDVVDTDDGDWVEDTAAVEPVLRAGATDELDARRPPTDVAGELEAIASACCHGER